MGIVLSHPFPKKIEMEERPAIVPFHPSGRSVKWVRHQRPISILALLRLEGTSDAILRSATDWLRVYPPHLCVKVYSFQCVTARFATRIS